MGVFLIGLFAVLFMIIIEKTWTPYQLGGVKYDSHVTKILVEPNEEIHLVSQVTNKTPFPIGYVQTKEFLPAGAKLKGSDEYRKSHNYAGSTWTVCYRNMVVKGKSTEEKEDIFTLDKRGLYFFGDYELNIGDFLGFAHRGFNERRQRHVVVMPDRIEGGKVIEVLGGFIGDISVRRFIQEDPILTVGFSEYTGREPFKDISWTRSAIAGDLMVKKYDHTTDVKVTILLNLEDGSKEEIEKCFCLTRKAAEMLEEKKIPYEFRSNGCMLSHLGGFFWMPKGMGSQHLNTLLYGLGGASHTAYFPLDVMLNRAREARQNGENYILITPPLSEKNLACLNRFQAENQIEMCMLIGEEESHE